jgi:hypothetical protein
MNIYEPRYTQDILTKYALYDFDNQTTYDTWKNDANNAVRESGLPTYNSAKNIQFTETLNEMTDSEFESFKADIVSQTWGEQYFDLCVIPGISVDAFIGDPDAKPANDTWLLHPGWVYL